MKALALLLPLGLTGCASTLEAAQGMDPALVWSVGGFIFLVCLGVAAIIKSGN